MLLGLTTPAPASAKPPSGEDTNRLGPCSESRPCAATRAVAGAAAISTIASAQAGATATTSKRLALNAASGIAIFGERCSTRTCSCCAAIASTTSFQGGSPTDASRIVRDSAIRNAASIVHSVVPNAIGETNATSSWWPKRTRVICARRSSSVITSARAGSSAPATRTASAPRIAARVDAGTLWPARATATPPNATCVSSMCNPWSRATASSARTASAISSGAVPAPVRHATVAVRLMPSSPPGRALRA